MLSTLSIISPIYITIALGFFLTRAGLFAKADMQVFGRFVINIALPAMLFNAIAAREFGEIINLTYIAAYLLGSLLVLGVGYFWSSRVAGLDATASTFRAMGMSCSNSGFVGYPILLLTFAPVAGVALALNLMVENLVVIPLLLLLAERSREGPGQGQWRLLGQTVQRLARNPLIVALLAALLVSGSGLQLPQFAASTLNLIAAASGALSLFVIGGSLVGLQLKGLGRQVMPVTLGKLVLHPLAVLLIISLLQLLEWGDISPSLKAAAILMAAMPMMSIYPTLAQKYGEEEFSAAAMFLTAVVSFFTLSGLLGLLDFMSLSE